MVEPFWTELDHPAVDAGFWDNEHDYVLSSYFQGDSVFKKSLIDLFLIAGMLHVNGGKSGKMQENSKEKINITGHSVIQK